MFTRHKATTADGAQLKPGIRMVKHGYRGSASVRNDVVIVIACGNVEVWADEGGQHGIVASFDNGRDAVSFVWKHYHL